MKTVPSEYNNRITIKTEFRIKIVNFRCTTMLVVWYKIWINLTHKASNVL